MKTHFSHLAFIFLLVSFSSLAQAEVHSIDSNTNVVQTSPHISSNPAAVNITPGTGALQRYFEDKWGIKNNHGIQFEGAWLSDVNRLFSGGIPNAAKSSVNSLFLASLAIDAEKLMQWKGGLFNIQFLQFNGGATNEQAGTIQGYNSLPGAPPLNRSELYQLWFRQSLFDDKFIVRIGKVVPTFEFNNVVKPIPLTQQSISVPAVSGLIYTPIFVNTTLLGVLPGYYNSAYGITINLAPIKRWYISLGTYDGNIANGTQTGLTGPHFNGSYFSIGETGFAWLLGKNHLPGTIGIGAWRQTGLIKSFPNLMEHGATGYYFFGSQRLWYRHPEADNSGISAFYQFGNHHSHVLPMNRYLGGGITAFGLIPQRINDSMGVGAAYSWLNRQSLSRNTELMLQAYYQAQLMKVMYLEPALSYIPTPAELPHLHAAWAGTLRFILLF